jgi:hypothetical protein
MNRAQWFSFWAVMVAAIRVIRLGDQQSIDNLREKVKFHSYDFPE